MARMYSRKKGKSGSKKPERHTKPSWVTHDKKVVEQLVLKFGKQRIEPSRIGLLLRDSYGIPDVKDITGKSISATLAEHQLAKKLPEDIAALIVRSIALMKHLELNKKDVPARRGLQLTESKIDRLSRYYKSTGKLPADWKYEASKAKLLVE